VKAIVLRRFGGPDVLQLEDVADPTPGPGEVVVRVEAVSVNRSFDLAVRAGIYARGANLPLVMGADPSGVIVEAPADDPRLRVGDRVTVMSTVACGACRPCLGGDAPNCARSTTIGVHRWGGYAEYVAVPARNVARVPEGVSAADATVIGRHGSAAWNFLVNRGGLRPGETMLVMGAAGALGSFGVQVGNLLGVRVIAAAGSDSRVAAAMALGADAGVNYRSQDLTAEVLRLTDGAGVDLVFENISDPTLWPKALECLAQSGRMVTAGAHGGGTVPLDVRRLYTRRLRIIGAAGTTLLDVEQALTFAAKGRLRASIDRVMPLHEAAEAHRMAELNRSTGKIILAPI
jgi:NADPH2:quinone reductase